MKRILTIEQLMKFCQENDVTHFNAADNNTFVTLTTYGEITYSANDDPSLMSVVLKACHCGLNRNNSRISEETMTSALPSFSNKPILAEIIDTDNGKDFGSHAMELVEDEDGVERVRYIERCVGIIPESCNAHLEYDKENDKTYVIVNGYIYNEYGNETASIIKRKNGTKVSVELAVNDFSYSAKDKCLDINDFIFMGVTLLGEDVGEGMLGSRLDMASFSQETFYDYKSELLEMQEKINTILSSFQIDIPKEGGNLVNKFEELLQKYNKTIEDIEFEYENLSDEELEAKFAEVFGEDDTNGEGADPEPTSDGDEGDGDETNTDEGNAEQDTDPVVVNESVKPSKYSITMSDGTVKEFELSLDEIYSAIYNLVNDAYSESDNTWYTVTVYESHVIMHDWWNERSYKQTYKREDNNFNLTGDRVEVYSNWLTKEEEEALAEMRANYEALKQFKVDTEAAQLHAQREVILSDVKFESIAETDEFKALVSKMDEYSVADLEKEAKVILADNYSATFAYVPDKKPTTIKFSVSGDDAKEKPYGNLFD